MVSVNITCTFLDLISYNLSLNFKVTPINSTVLKFIKTLEIVTKRLSNKSHVAIEKLESFTAHLK